MYIPFSYEIKILFDFSFSREKIKRITFCITDLVISLSQGIYLLSNLIGVATQLSIVLYTFDRLKR